MTKVFVLVSTLAIFVGQGCGDSEGAGNNGNQGGTGGVGGTAGGGGNGAGTPQGGTGPGTHIWSRRLDVTENYEGPSVAEIALETPSSHPMAYSPSLTRPVKCCGPSFLVAARQFPAATFC